MSNKKSSQKGIENWPTWKLLSIYFGSWIIFFFLLHLMVTTSNNVLKYVVYSLYILLGLFMVLRSETVGSAIFESNRRTMRFLHLRMLRFLWCRIFRMNEDKLRKRLDEMESGPGGLKFHIIVTFFVGIWLIASSILFIVWFP